jgi:hypothetical protein
MTALGINIEASATPLRGISDPLLRKSLRMRGHGKLRVMNARLRPLIRIE